MKRYLYILSVGLFILSACGNEETPVTATVNDQDNKELVYAYAGMPGNVPFTRLNLVPTTNTNNENILSVTWENSGEEFSVYDSSGTTPNPFSQVSIDSNPHKAIFSGYMTPVNGATYYAFYPIGGGSGPTNISLDMSGQDGTLNSSKVYMYDSSSLNNNTLNFVFEHLTAVMEVEMAFPSISATTEVQDMKPGGVVTPATRSSVLAGQTMTNTSFTAGDLAISGTADITATSGNVKLTTMGNIDFGSAKFTLSNDTPPTAKVYLHLLPATLTNLTVTAKVGNSIYKGVITNSCTISEGYFYTASVNMKRQMSVGDLMLQSGAIIDPDFYDATGSDKAIGIVAHLFDNNIRNVDGIKSVLKKEPTGLVMALENAITAVAWSSDRATTPIETKGTLELAYTYGQDGYALTEGISKIKGFSDTTFPAAYYAKNYRSTETEPAPSNTTGWYLPSIGEWIDMFGSISGSTNYNTWKSYPSASCTVGTDREDVVEAVNDCLKKAINGYDFIIGTDEAHWFWSSSEYSSEQVYCVGFYTTNSYVLWNNPHKINPSANTRVRPILAF